MVFKPTVLKFQRDKELFVKQNKKNILFYSSSMVK